MLYSIGLFLGTFAVIFMTTWILSEQLTAQIGLVFPFTDNQARAIFIPSLITGIILFIKGEKQ